MRRLFALLSAAVALRVALVLRGGQYFDWDEYRYGFATIMFARLREGDVGGMVDVLFRYPEHPGFKLLGLIPASLHAVAARAYGHPIWDMRYPTGEWIAALVFSLASVWSIGMVYAIARRAGAGDEESLLASFLAFASTNMVMHAPHFFPYDLSLAAFLSATWLAMSERTGQSLAAGVAAGGAFAIYEGYWLLVAAVAFVHLWHRPPAARATMVRLAAFIVGFALIPGMLIALSAWRGRQLLEATLRFSKTVTHGDYGEGWSLPWAFFWHAEHALLLLVLTGAGIGAIVARSRRARLWTAAAALIYLGLVAGSNVLHRFVVYDRLARQMWPFLCVAAAAGLASWSGGRYLRGPRGRLLYGLIGLLFVFNAWPVATLRYPREIVGGVVAQYGRADLAFDTTLLGTVDSTSAMFLPLENDDRQRTGARYLLVNARDIWIEGPPGIKPQPAGMIIATWRHPRQLKLLQYHGYSADQRRFLREHDVAIRLIDTAAR